MGVLQGLGAFAGGVANGIGMRAKIDEIKENREARNAQKAGMDAYIKKIKELEQQEEAPITVENRMQSTQKYDFTAPQQEVGLSNVNQEADLQLFADGGEFQAGLSSTQQPKMDFTAQAQPARRNPMKMAQNVRDAYYAAAEAAHAKGGSEAAMQFLQLGFQQEDKIFKQEKARAMNAFDISGDLSPLVPIYNDMIPDGHSIIGHEKTPDGKYKMLVQTPDNKQIEQVYSKEDILSMASQIDDPATRFAMRAKSLLEQQNKKFETDEKIRADKEIENNKTHSYGLDNVIVKGDKVLYDGSTRTKPGAWKDDILSLGGGNYIRKNADGSQTVVNAPSKTSGTKKEATIKYDDVNEAVLGYEGMGQINDVTGKITPTKAGNEALIFGQRLLQQHPNLPPADIARLAAEAATNPKALDYEVVEREDGSRYKRQVIKYGEQIYRLGTSSSIPQSKPSQDKQGNAPATASMQAPKEASLRSVRPIVEQSSKTNQPEYETFYQKQRISYLEKELGRLGSLRGKYAEPEKLAYLTKLIAAKKAAEPGLASGIGTNGR